MNDRNVVHFSDITIIQSENVSRFGYSYSMNDENAIHFLDILILWSENRGLCPHAPTIFSCLDTRKDGKRKSRPLPRPGKLTGYMIDLENASRFGGITIV